MNTTPLWTNAGRRVYIARFGQEAWDRFSVEQYPQWSKPGLWSGLVFWLKTVLIGLGFVSVALTKGKRRSHPRGVGLGGSLEVVANPAFPAHPFFQPSRRFSIRLRHSNLSPKHGHDDAALLIRGAALKFEDADEGGPCDLVMNSGARPVFWSCRDLFPVGLYPADSTGRKAVKREEMYRHYPAKAVGQYDCLRRAPSSYSAVGYHTKFVMHFDCSDGVARYARFRLVPPGWRTMADDSGLPDEEHEARLGSQLFVTPWELSPGRDPAEARPPDYLQRELEERTRDGGKIAYLLQVQLHEGEPSEAEAREVFNPMIAWDSPWMDLARVEADRVLPPELTERTRFDPGVVPEGMRIMRARVQEDPASILWMRASIYRASGAARKLGRRLRGA